MSYISDLKSLRSKLNKISRHFDSENVNRKYFFFFFCRLMMSRWRMLPRHSLTTLQPPRRPTITDRPLRSTTQTRPSGFLTSGCPAGSTPLTHQPGPYLSTNLTRLNKFPGLKVSAAVLQLKARLGRVVRWSMFFLYPSPTRIRTHPHLITTVSGKGTTIH